MILQDVHDELIAAAGRPSMKARISIRVIAVVVAAILALLIAAPPSVARLPTSTGVAVGQLTR